MNILINFFIGTIIVSGFFFVLSIIGWIATKEDNYKESLFYTLGALILSFVGLEIVKDLNTPAEKEAQELTITDNVQNLNKEITYMVEESYVSFETAKLLKEKGFNENTKSYYVCEDNDVCVGYVDGLDGVSNSELDGGFCTRPTIQMAMRWLRETQRIFIVISIVTDPFTNAVYYYYTIRPFGKVFETVKDCKLSGENVSTYEEAEEAAIKYVLETFL